MKGNRISGSSANRNRERRAVPSALMVGPTQQYGSDKQWYMGVVLQQACQALTGGPN